MIVRALWTTAGFVLVAIGGIAIVVPLLPTTVFFVGAAWCFARSSQRLETWLLNLPGVGQMVDDYRSGRGMPRRTKVFVVSAITIAVSFSAFTTRDKVWLPFVIAAVGIIGIWYVSLQVPTTEVVLANIANDDLDENVSSN